MGMASVQQLINIQRKANNMKKLILFLFFIYISSTLFAQQTETVEHKLTHATIYTNRAMLTREANLDLQKGAYIIRFDRIPDNMDLRSIRVIDPTNPNIEINGISWERIITKQIDNLHLAKLEKEQIALNYLTLEKTNNIDVLNVRHALMNQYIEQASHAIEEQAYKNASGSEKILWWKNALNHKVNESIAIADSITKIHEEINKIQIRSHEIDLELSKYFSSNIRRSHICLSVSLIMKSASEFPLQVSYLTHLASWDPLYSARLYDENKKLELGYNGVVFQTTGENWQDITLVLSTAQPQISAIPPAPLKTVLKGRSLNPNERYQYIDKQVAFESEARAINGVVATGFSDDFSSISQEGPAVTFQIKGTHSILSGDQPTQVVITENKTNVYVVNECIPALRQGIYMKAQFNNKTPYPILAGKADLYRSTGYIGTTSFKYTAPGTSVEFFAGMVNNVGNSYTPPNTYNRIIGAFSSTEETYSANQTTDLINNTEHSLTVCVKMQIPVSELEEVTVELIHQKMTIHSETEVVLPTTPNYQLDKKNGIVSWEITLKPMTQKKVCLSYKITKPYKR